MDLNYAEIAYIASTWVLPAVLAIMSQWPGRFAHLTAGTRIAIGPEASE